MNSSFESFYSSMPFRNKHIIFASFLPKYIEFENEKLEDPVLLLIMSG